MVNILMQENTYDEMHTIYAKVPGIFKSIFTLPYLKRKSYSEVYGTGYILQKDLSSTYKCNFLGADNKQ